MRDNSYSANACQSQGKTIEVRDLLAANYGWFIEGFYTADLKEAKALLEELGYPSHRALLR